MTWYCFKVDYSQSYEYGAMRPISFIVKKLITFKISQGCHCCPDGQVEVRGRLVQGKDGCLETHRPFPRSFALQRTTRTRSKPMKVHLPFELPFFRTGLPEPRVEMCLVFASGPSGKRVF